MKVRRRIATAVALLAAFLGVIASQRQLDRQRRDAFDEELLYLPNEKLLTHCTAGLSGVVADVLWLKCIQYTATHFRGDYKFTWLNHMCDTITRLDPHFVDVYRFGAVFLAALKADDEASINLLKRGMVRNPYAWQLPYEAAMVYLLNRRTQPDSPYHAAQFLAIAAATGTAPQRIVDLAAGIQRQQNLEGLERAMWEDIAKTSSEELMRELAQRRLVLLDIRDACARLDQYLGQYVAQQGQAPARLDDLVAAGIVKAIPPDRWAGSSCSKPTGESRTRACWTRNASACGTNFTLP